MRSLISRLRGSLLHLGDPGEDFGAGAGCVFWIPFPSLISFHVVLCEIASLVSSLEIFYGFLRQRLLVRVWE
jgi:hypothetical protein